jgi:aerobic carbon-monoxide dehydrogenase large subunit
MPSGLFGEAVKRREDPTLLIGEGKFTADMSLPNQLHMAIVHSPHAHATIKGIDASAALAMPGVVRVVTGADVADKMMRLPVIMNPGGQDAHFLPHPYGLPGAQTVLATDRARYVGEWVAAVLAETRDQAYAAAEAVKVDYEPLEAVATAEGALKGRSEGRRAAAPRGGAGQPVHACGLR